MRRTRHLVAGSRLEMLSLYRAWLGPSPCVARPAPPPGAHRPVPRLAKAATPPSSPPPPRSPSPSTSSELDVEHIEEPPKQRSKTTVLDIASCDGPVKFSRVLNAAWQEQGNSDPNWCRHRKQSRPAVQYYPCKTCGCKFPSYYFVHKHRKQCHAEEAKNDPEPSTSSATK